MIDIEKIKENVDVLSKSLSSLKIDSIFIEQNDNIERIFYKNEELHELRSCTKLVVALAMGVAIEKRYEKCNRDITKCNLNERKN